MRSATAKATALLGERTGGECLPVCQWQTRKMYWCVYKLHSEKLYGGVPDPSVRVLVVGKGSCDSQTTSMLLIVCP